MALCGPKGAHMLVRALNPALDQLSAFVLLLLFPPLDPPLACAEFVLVVDGSLGGDSSTTTAWGTLTLAGVGN